MWTQRIIPDSDLAPYIARYPDHSLASRMKALYDQQKRIWARLRRGHEDMRKAQIRRIELENQWVLCLHSPHRIESVSARVDVHSIANRPCFLCPQNLYDQEKGLPYGDDYAILCNVSPIFDFHLVITHRDHVPQQIEGHLDDALRLVQDLSPQFVLIYNGPRCGASAPDHLHFQAFPRGNLPLEDQIWGDHPSQIPGIVTGREGILMAAPHGFSRRFLTFDSDHRGALSFWFHRTLETLAKTTGMTGEPMINLVMAYHEGQWRMILFPRERHRPRCYHNRGDRQLLISPGAIDMAGVFVIPRENDYHRIDARILRGIYEEVTLSEDRFSRLMEELERANW